MKKIRFLLAVLVSTLVFTGCTTPNTSSTSSNNSHSDFATYYSVFWRNYDNSLITTSQIREGETPVYRGSTPRRSSEGVYKYVFTGWDKEPEPAYSNQTYVAQYRQEIDYSGFGLILSEDGTYYTAHYNGSRKNLAVPENCNGLPVKAVYFQAECINEVETIYFPDSIEYIYCSIRNDALRPLQLKEIRMSKNIKVIDSLDDPFIDAYYYSILPSSHPEELDLGVFSRMNLYEDDNGFYMAIGENKKGILVHSKTQVLDQDVELICCHFAPEVESFDFSQYPNLRYINQFGYVYDGSGYNKYQNYKTINTGDKLTHFLYRGHCEKLIVGKNIETLNRHYSYFYDFFIENNSDILEKHGYIHFSDFRTPFYETDKEDCFSMVDAIEIDAENKYFYSENNIMYTKDKKTLLYACPSVGPEITTNPNLEVIKDKAFYKCPELKTIHFNEGLIEIESTAFYGCYNLGDVVLPNSLVYLRKTAFLQCFSLLRITLGENCTLLQDALFWEMSWYRNGSLVEIINHSNVPTEELKQYCYYVSVIDDISESKVKLENGFYTYDNTDGLIRDQYIEGLYLDTLIVRYDGVSESVTVNIYEEPHILCENALKHSSRNLKELIFNTEARLFGSTVSYCDGLESVSVCCSKLPSSDWTYRLDLEHNHSLKTVDIGAFCETTPSVIDCPNIEHFYLGDDVVDFRAVGLESAFTTYENAHYIGTKTNPYHVFVKALDSSLESYVIHPECRIIALQAFWFEEGSNIKQINIPNKVTTIEPQAFLECKQIKEVNIPGSVTHIGQMPFMGCTSLEKINYRGSLKTLLSANQRYLSVAIRGGYVPEYPDDVSAEVHLYLNDSSQETKTLLIKDVSFNSNYRDIPIGAFEDCVGIENVVIDEFWQNFYIRADAFRRCRSLTSITLPSTTESIDVRAFKDCTSLTNIVFRGTIEQWNAVQKWEEWNENVPAQVVHCSDGDVSVGE